MQYQEVRIIKNTAIAPHIYSIWLEAKDIAKKIKAGQFLMLTINNHNHPFLARPFSIADTQPNSINIIYKVVGFGTELLSRKAKNEKISIFGPLGKSLKLPKNKVINLCAGGMGIAPLHFLAKKLSVNNQLTLYYGVKTASELIFQKEFKSLGIKTFITTEDGSFGRKGLITELLFNDLDPQTQYLYVAGPMTLVKKVAAMKLPSSNLQKIGFLEEHMGCGCGICFCCGVKGKNNHYLRVCQDGPAFDLSKIEL
ncbi:MAG: dihydroorotate dehydrogenase electron transfer subunit [candidate division WOR-3 bacterium]